MGRGRSGTGGGGGGGTTSSSGSGGYKGHTAGRDGTYTLGSNATKSEALDVANNAPFTETTYGKSLGVKVKDHYNVERSDGSVTPVTRDVTYSVSYGQNSDGTWSTHNTGTSVDNKKFKSEAAAERNARKALARDVSNEIGWGRTLSMKTGNWKRRNE